MVDHGLPVRRRLRLARQEREGPDQSFSTDAERAPVLHAQEPTGPTRGSREQRGDVRTGSHHGLGGGNQLLVPAMEQYVEKTRKGDTGAARAQDGDRDSQAAGPADSLPQRGGALPCNPTSVGQHGVRDHSLHVGAAESECREPAGPCSVLQAGQEQLLAPHRIHHETFQAGTQCVGSAAGETPSPAVTLTPGAALGLALRNASSHCYANSAVHAILWNIACSPAGVTIASPTARRFLQWLVHKPQTVELWKIRAWVGLVSSWESPHRQHDVAEFLQQQLQAVAPLDTLRSQWQSRLQAPDGNSQVVDQGTLWPLLLQVAVTPEGRSPTGCCSLQALFIQWRNQAMRHALTSDPSVLCVQICRFDSQGSKLRFPVSFSAAVYIPVFAGDTLVTRSTRYLLHSVVYHLGESKHSGHYRCGFLTQGRLSHTTDDNRIARPASESDVREVSENAYLIFVHRCL